jgi:hypothetical protein
MRYFYFFAFNLIFTLLTVLAMGQEQRFNGGVQAGVAAAEISGDRLEGPNKAGIYAGGFVNRYFTERSSLQMELNFIQKGSRKNPDTLDNSNFYLLRLNYVELFLHYKWDFAKSFTLEAGPSFGVLINSYEEADGQILTEPPFNAGDLSGNIGLFYTFSQRLRFNIRYSNSILAVRAHSSGETYKWNQGQYNEVLSFTFHYQF